MKKVLYAFAASLMAVFFIGCGGQGQPQVRTLPQIEQNKKIVKFNFPEYDCVTGEKIDFDLKSYNLSNKITKLSNYTKVQEYRAVQGLNNVKGIDIYKSSNNAYIINYKKGKHYINSNFWSLTEVIFKIPYKIKNKTTLEFSYPTSYKHIPAKDSLGIDIDPLDKITNLQKDINRIFNKLDTIKLKITKTYKLKGEINTKFPSESIYANFKRILGEWRGRYYYSTSGKKVTTSDIKKENTFTLHIGKNQYPLEIEVYPYRNGSKVIYSVIIPYTISSDNTCSLTKKDIEKAKKFIEKAIND